MSTQPLLHEFIRNPSDDIINYRLGLHYNGLNQSAAAVSFFIRAAERTCNNKLQYECLIRASLCFESQGNRGLSVRGLLKHAISLEPKRPEAYYFLARFYETTASINSTSDDSVEHWFNGYSYASIAMGVVEFNSEPLTTPITEYVGKHGIRFEQGVCAWWCGLCEESKNIMLELKNEPALDLMHKKAVESNLKFLGEVV